MLIYRYFNNNCNINGFINCSDISNCNQLRYALIVKNNTCERIDESENSSKNQLAYYEKQNNLITILEFKN